MHSLVSTESWLITLIRCHLMTFIYDHHHEHCHKQNFLQLINECLCHHILGGLLILVFFQGNETSLPWKEELCRTPMLKAKMFLITH